MMDWFFSFAAEIRESTQEPDDDAFYFNAYQLGGKHVTEFMQKNADQESKHPKKCDYYFPQIDRLKEIIRDRYAEQHGKMEADIHAAYAAKCP
jgi:hypothetical protein